MNSSVCLSFTQTTTMLLIGDSVMRHTYWDWLGLGLGLSLGLGLFLGLLWLGLLLGYY